MAEPGALIVLLGPRVRGALYQEQFPDYVLRSENLYAHGLVDAVLTTKQVRAYASKELRVLSAYRDGSGQVVGPPDSEPVGVSAWESIQRSRSRERPGCREFLGRTALDVTRLHCAGANPNDPGLLLALARFGSVPAVVVGHDRTRAPEPASLRPKGMRAAWRGMQLARELRIPLVTIIDTAGADVSQKAEEAGLAGSIARCVTETGIS